MNNEKAKRAEKIIKVTSAVICALASAFFTLAGAVAGSSELGIHTLISLPTPVWIAWGLFWGAVCGFYGAKFLINKLTKKRNALYGLSAGFATGIVMGAVNGFLTGTAIFGIILGAVLSPIPGLIFAAIFLNLTSGE